MRRRDFNLAAIAAADLNGDGIVNALDLAIFKKLFGKTRGPSGLVPLRRTSEDTRAQGKALRPLFWRE